MWIGYGAGEAIWCHGGGGAAATEGKNHYYSAAADCMTHGQGSKNQLPIYRHSGLGD